MTSVTIFVFLYVSAAAVPVHPSSDSPIVVSLEREEFSRSEASIRDADRARFLREKWSGAASFGLQGDALPYSEGMYYATLELGSPPRNFILQIDTGSDITWIGCKKNIPDGRTTYDVTKSSTGPAVSCKGKWCKSLATSTQQCQKSALCLFEIQYMDSTASSGFFVSDNVSLTRNLDSVTTVDSSAQLIFGCSTRRTDHQRKDGILGLGHLNSSFVSQMFAQRKIPPVFSHCLSGKKKGGGFLIFGSVELLNTVYTPLVPGLSYNLAVESILVNGIKLRIDPRVFANSGGRGTIVDSGTTLGLLVAEAFDPFVTAISYTVNSLTTVMGYEAIYCYRNLSASSMNMFPSVHINFAGGASMLLRPENYLFEDVSSGLLCIAFQRSEDISILGDSMLKDRLIVYDLYNRRIGWHDYDCSVDPKVAPYFPSGNSRPSVPGVDLASWVLAATVLQVLFTYI